MQNINNLEDLLVHHLQNLYASEDLILHAMPSIIEKASHASLKNALKHHLDLTGEQKKRIEKTVKHLNEDNSTGSDYKLSQSETCKGMAGLIEEANELLESELTQDVTDAAIISCVQKIEHYEICTYGTAIAYAKQLHLHKIEVLLKETLDEEYDADDLLTALATSSYNKEAAPEGLEDEQASNTGTEDDSAGASKENKVSITERTIISPGGRAGTSHRGYSTGESRGH